MIKIIKDGQKDFIGKCRTCGCEFSYQLTDLSLGSVVCPCCGGYITHKVDGDAAAVGGKVDVLIENDTRTIPRGLTRQTTADWHPSNVALTSSDNDSRFDSLKTIHDLCVDYDGFNMDERLKSLVDDIREITEKNLAGKGRG